MSPCTHLDTVEFKQKPADVEGCQECLAAGQRTWEHLRMCTVCGHVGCCDESPGRHATAHFRETRHPIITSLEPGEDWSWCYYDAALLQTLDR